MIKQFGKLCLILCLVLILITPRESTLAQSVENPNVLFLEDHILYCSFEHSPNITPYADIIGWKYSVINGQLHRRLYNFTKQVWMGQWELVP